MAILVLPRPGLALGEGSSDERILGTKKSGPRGVESNIEYNGLYMNIREWIDTFVVSTINGLDDADIRDAREPNPGQHGETPFPAFYGGRTIVLQGKVLARTIWKLRDMQQALRGAFADINTEYPLVFRTEDASTDMMIYCKKSQNIVMADEQQTLDHFERSFQITLRASKPYFVSYLEEFHTAVANVGTTPLFTLNNNGNFPALPRIRIYGPLSSSTPGGRALALTNERNGQKIFINALAGSTDAIVAGRYFEIDIAKNTMNAYDATTGAFIGNRFDRLDPASDWMELVPGLDGNAISAELTTSSGIQIQFNHRHTVI
jgi:hypothetical protein